MLLQNVIREIGNASLWVDSIFPGLDCIVWFTSNFSVSFDPPPLMIQSSALAFFFEGEHVACWAEEAVKRAPRRKRNFDLVMVNVFQRTGDVATCLTTIAVERPYGNDWNFVCATGGLCRFCVRCTCAIAKEHFHVRQ